MKSIPSTPSLLRLAKLVHAFKSIQCGHSFSRWGTLARPKISGTAHHMAKSMDGVCMRVVGVGFALQ